jgi:uncharacterized membrane protein
MKTSAPEFSLDHDRVVAAIGDAERKTSGEIRVLVFRSRADDPVLAAKRQFERLGMTRTRERNGVLIFLAPRSRTFAIVGDRGIHEKCGEAFWRELSDAMSLYFQRGDFTTGLLHGIARAGTLLGDCFPRSDDDRNELDDRVEEAE